MESDQDAMLMSHHIVLVLEESPVYNHLTKRSLLLFHVINNWDTKQSLLFQELKDMISALGL